MKITVYEGAVKHELSFSEGETILSVLQRGKIESITAPCGGKGTCKKCTVSVTSEEFTGECLACTTPAKDGMVVELVPEIRISIAESSNVKLYPYDLRRPTRKRRSFPRGAWGRKTQGDLWFRLYRHPGNPL